MLFALFSLSGASQSAEKKNKNPSKSTLVEVVDFKKSGFSVNQGENTANADALASILTTGERKSAFLKQVRMIRVTLATKGRDGMNERELWEQFTKSGRVEDYLRYRSVSNATNAVQREEDGYGGRQTTFDDRRSDRA